MFLQTVNLKILQTQFPSSYPFPCNVSGFRSLKPPTNVNQVRPGDIDIVGAMGDSITSGYGIIATNLYQMGVENRGLSWCIGGQNTWREFTTLPNILKVFNPNLFGFSTTDSLSTDLESQFNLSQGAAFSSELPYMAQILIKRIKSDPRVNLLEHWKMITILIGDVDFCQDICVQDDFKLFIENHRADLVSVLRILRDNLARTIVNLTPPPSLKLYSGLNGNDTCSNIQRIACPCFFSKHTQPKLEIFYSIIQRWQEIDEEIASMEEFQTNNFSVISQPFFTETTLPVTSENVSDYTNLSRDCFHLSQKLHAQVATSLWNNMMERVGSKSRSDSPLMELICPTKEHPYIFTAQNSKS